MVAKILQVRDEHPCWGGRKIRRRLQDVGETEVPAASTITAILHRHGRIDPEESQKRHPLTRFEREQPNELWQMDFKGEFRLTNGHYCYPLTVLDDHSRYSLVLQACENQRRQTVQTHLTRAFQRYGLPHAMLMDNGSPWAAPHVRGGHTRLTVWLMDLDVGVLHGRPHHPQTQGKEERFHRTLLQEVLQGRHFTDLSETQSRFDPWRQTYNQVRPHEALALGVPASRYRVSERSYREELLALEFEYDVSFTVRRVRREGRIRLHGKDYFVGGAFGGRAVGLRPTPDDGQWDVCYRTFPVATLDERTGRVVATSVRSAHSSGHHPAD
jgi:transposase InsO family protein